MTDATLGRAGRPAATMPTGGRVPAARRQNPEIGGAARAARPATPVRATGAPVRARAIATPPAARLLVGAGLAMLPWLVYLGATLPARDVAVHWDVVWVGLDTAEMAGLVATGLLLRAGDARRALTATFTATLLAVDAWFDCGTAVTATDHAAAYAMAFGAELPLAAFLAVLAWRAFRLPRPPPR